MLRALDRWRRRGTPGQLELALPAHATDPTGLASAFLGRLRDLGLCGIRRCTLTANRSTVVSFRGDGLRVHRAFVTAPEDVLQAVVRFVN